MKWLSCLDGGWEGRNNVDSLQGRGRFSSTSAWLLPFLEGVIRAASGKNVDQLASFAFVLYYEQNLYATALRRIQLGRAPFVTLQEITTLYNTATATATSTATVVTTATEKTTATATATAMAQSPLISDVAVSEKDQDMTKTTKEIAAWIMRACLIGSTVGILVDRALTRSREARQQATKPAPEPVASCNWVHNGADAWIAQCSAGRIDREQLMRQVLESTHWLQEKTRSIVVHGSDFGVLAVYKGDY